MTVELDEFIHELRQTPAHNGIFNPWFERDREHDCTPEAPSIRRRQLRGYLAERLSRARYLLIGEALGYQGGHFSGLAMTSERILLGHKQGDGIPAEAVLPAGMEPNRTSRPALKEKGFSEPTATIVWGALLGSGADPRSFVLWNAFAWHPFQPEQGMLSNRRPNSQELAAGEATLKAFLGLFPGARALAVGLVAHETMGHFGLEAPRLRHPAHGGAPKFRRQWAEIAGAGRE
jgi:hypothetical protein